MSLLAFEKTLCWPVSVNKYSLYKYRHILTQHGQKFKFLVHFVWYKISLNNWLQFNMNNFSIIASLDLTLARSSVSASVIRSLNLNICPSSGSLDSYRFSFCLVGLFFVKDNPPTCEWARHWYYLVYFSPAHSHEKSD